MDKFEVKDGEIYKPLAEILVNYGEGYLISNYGRIWSEKHRKYLSPFTTNGIMRIKLSCDKRLKSFSIASLVAKSFLPNPKNKVKVKFIDGNRHNVSVHNLVWE